MATGYSNTWTKDWASLRIYYSTSYNASSNTSTVTITPQLKSQYNYGTDYRFFGNYVSGAGIYGNGSKLYDLGNSISGNALSCGSCHSSFTDLSKSFSFTVSHNSSGSASFTVGALGAAHHFYSGGVNASPLGSTSSSTITISQPAPYAITYNANGGSGAPSSQDVYAGVAYTISETQPTRSGCNFLGWSTSSTASSATYTGGQSVTPNGNLSLYAVWSYNVSYDANGGSDAPAAQVKTRGTNLTLSADVPTRTGYTFKGWATTSDALSAQYQPGGSYITDAPVTLYAVWQLDTFTLSITKSDDGIVLNVNRIDSPYGGGQSGLLSNGATLYYGDKISVAYALNSGYTIDTATINGVDMGGTSETINSVTTDVAVVVLTELLALAYVDNGASFEAYQIYIDNGASFDLYQAYIDNGVSWDAF